VGLEWGEWQAAEWHGPDCSLKRCPMGDDPMTRANETDCKGVVPKGSSEAGKEGNGCVVECSNRGVCQYEEVRILQRPGRQASEALKPKFMNTNTSTRRFASRLATRATGDREVQVLPRFPGGELRHHERVRDGSW